MADGVLYFDFGGIKSDAGVRYAFPSMEEVLFDAYGSKPAGRPVFVCDENTLPFVTKITEGGISPAAAVCVLPAGEGAKTWASVRKILVAARKAGIWRDGAVACLAACKVHCVLLRKKLRRKTCAKCLFYGRSPTGC
jgi:hypothetical protein